MEQIKFEYQTVKTRSGQTGYIMLGKGKPLVMLVGYSGNLLHWNSTLIFELAKKYTVYLPDNRLVGLSTSTNEESMTGLARDTLDFIDALQLEKPILCGWSMGGIIAQALAHENSERISGLAFIVSQPDYSYTMGRLHQLVANLRENPGKENRDRLTELFFSGMPSIEFRKYLAKTILPIAHYVYPFNAAAQALQDKAVANWQVDEEKLMQISLPALITVAKNDWVTKPEASYKLHQLLTNSKLISYPDGGHFFLHHYPEELASQIINFFN
ncbi:MAG: alpha/beta hydrolase [Neisseriales bacterium]|nr:MAG: alpha/beta hydrolase [Neisseriales bacterium]